VRAAVHCNKLATATDNHQLLLWDLNCSQIAFSIDISCVPTALKFSHSGDILVMGCSTGELVFYDVTGFSLTAFHQLLYPGYSVLCLQFSDSDGKLAVSLVPIRASREKAPYVEVL